LRLGVTLWLGMETGMGGEGAESNGEGSRVDLVWPTSSTFSKADEATFWRVWGCSGGKRGTKPTGTVERSWGKAGVFFSRAICISFNSRIS